jgi:hypothetical protein
MPTRPPRGWPCQTPCSYARRFGCLYTLFDQDHDLVFLFFLSIKPTMLPTSMLGDYSTRASLTPSCFLRRTNQLGNLFLIMSLLDLLFLLLFLDQHTGHPTCHDVQILLYEFILDSLWNFFIVISIYWKPASYRSSLDLFSISKIQTGRLIS